MTAMPEPPATVTIVETRTAVETETTVVPTAVRRVPPLSTLRGSPG